MYQNVFSQFVHLYMYLVNVYVSLTALSVCCSHCDGLTTLKELSNDLNRMPLNVCPFNIIVCL